MGFHVRVNPGEVRFVEKLDDEHHSQLGSNTPSRKAVHWMSLLL
jgi:hypothetical protein